MLPYLEITIYVRIYIDTRLIWHAWASCHGLRSCCKRGDEMHFHLDLLSQTPSHRHRPVLRQNRWLHRRPVLGSLSFQVVQQMGRTLFGWICVGERSICSRLYILRLLQYRFRRAVPKCRSNEPKKMCRNKEEWRFTSTTLRLQLVLCANFGKCQRESSPFGWEFLNRTSWICFPTSQWDLHRRKNIKWTPICHT